MREKARKRERERVYRNDTPYLASHAALDEQGE
jgi:hypothetical protein